MDRSKTDDTAQGGGFLGNLWGRVCAMFAPKKDARWDAVLNFARFLLGLVFSRTHIIFGAHPLGVALLSVMPRGVWWTLLGSIIGSLTLGRAGIIYAMISIIVVFLRIIVGGSGKDGAPLFSENLLLRVSVSVIGGFISGVYEALLSGLSPATLLFALGMVLVPPLVVISLSGYYDSDITLWDIISTDRRIFADYDEEKDKRLAVLFYQLSVLLLLLLVSLSLKEYSLVGVSAAYIAASMATLFVARRFDPVRAAAVGFACTVGLSTEMTVAFILLGIGAGLLFRIGIPHALIGGGVIISAWSGYAGGVVGLVSLLPEYAIAAIISWPLSTRLKAQKSEQEQTRISTTARECVGTISLHYKNKLRGSLGSLEGALSTIATTISREERISSSPTRDELYALIGECHCGYCRGCSMEAACAQDHSLAPAEQRRLSTVLYTNKCITAEDFNTLPTRCEMRVGLAEAVNRAYGILCQDKFQARRRFGVGEELELVSKMISEARFHDEEDKATNEGLEERLALAMKGYGMPQAVIKVFGHRRPHIIIACEDETGQMIASPELLAHIEKECGILLGKPDYYKNGNIAILECSTRRTYKVTHAYLGNPRDGEAISGDRCKLIETEGGLFYAMLSDGMGSGEGAAGAANYAIELLSGILPLSEPSSAALSMLNRFIRSRDPNYSTTLDMFSFDLYNGDACFIKSGSAPSYIKRDSSIFRINSRTAPLGLMPQLDAERIRVQVEPGDYIVMLSDGISASETDAPWLVELLSKSFMGSAREYAELILSTAEKNRARMDDMTVMVVKIER